MKRSVAALRSPGAEKTGKTSKQASGSSLFERPQGTKWISGVVMSMGRNS